MIKFVDDYRVKKITPPSINALGIDVAILPVKGHSRIKLAALSVLTNLVSIGSSVQSFPKKLYLKTGVLPKIVLALRLNSVFNKLQRGPSRLAEKTRETGQYIKKNRHRIALITGSALLILAAASLYRDVSPVVGNIKSEKEAFAFLRNNNITFCIYENNAKTKKLSKIVLEKHIDVPRSVFPLVKKILGDIQRHMSAHSVEKLEFF